MWVCGGVGGAGGVADGASTHHDFADDGTLLVHELVLHLLDGLLNGPWVESFHLCLIEEPDLS